MSNFENINTIVIKPEEDKILGLSLDFLFGMDYFNKANGLVFDNLPYKIRYDEGINIIIKNDEKLYKLLDAYLKTAGFDMYNTSQFLDKSSCFYKLIKGEKIVNIDNNLNYTVDLTDYKPSHSKYFLYGTLGSIIFENEDLLKNKEFHLSIFELLKGNFILKDRMMYFEIPEDAIIYETLLSSYRDTFEKNLPNSIFFDSRISIASINPAIIASQVISVSTSFDVNKITFLDHANKIFTTDSNGTIIKHANKILTTDNNGTIIKIEDIKEEE